MSNKSELYGGPVAPHNESIFASFEHGLVKTPNKLAVVSRSQRGDHLAEMVFKSTGSQPGRIKDSCLRWTYAEFYSVALNLAAGLSSQVWPADSSIVTFVPNGVEWLLVFLASIIAKTGIACLDVDMLKEPRRAELEAKLIQLRPSCIVVPGGVGASAVDHVLQNLDLADTLKVSLEADSPRHHGDTAHWKPFTSLCEPRSASMLAETAEAARHDDPNRTSMVIYTSGTSGGMPKGCAKHVASFVAYVKQRFVPLQDEKNSVWMMQTANFRAIAPFITLIAWRDASTEVLSTYPFHPKTFLDDIEEEHVTEMALIPAQAHAIAAELDVHPRDLPSVRLVGSGGDMVTSSLVAVIKRCLPKASYMTIHGMTECGAVFQWPWLDCTDSIPFHQGISPLGYPSPGTRIRMVGPTGEVVPRGEVGELHIQHGSVFKAYLREQVGTPELYTDEKGQWFKTGDLGIISEEGHVYIVGRAKDVVKRAAVSIAPAAIESCLQAYIGSQTVIVGKPHSTLGQEPFAIVEDFKGKTVEEIRAHVITMCGADWQLGGAVELKALGFDSFPLNSTGKIQKTALVRPVAEYIAVH